MSKLYLGIDVGSVSVDAALVSADGEVTWDVYRRHRGSPLEVAAEMLDEALVRLEGRELAGMAATGSGGKIVAEHSGGTFVNEIVAATRACARFHPEARTLIDMGGEDSKLVVFESGGGGELRVADFSMNTVCAAGTGAFLDEQAARLGLSIEDEFGRLAMKSEKPPTIAGRCSVFAKTDMIHLQQMATPDYDIVAGLCFALARTFRSNIGRGKNFDPPVVFQGGVAANSGMVRAFTEVLGLTGDQLIIPERHGVMSAIGAALELAARAAGAGSGGNGHKPEFRGSEPLRAYARSKGDWEAQGPLPAQDYVREIDPVPLPEGDGTIEAYLGVDVGSISTNVVVVDGEGRVLARRYLMTAGRPLEAVRKGLAEVGEELGARVEICGACTTGSGRYLTADYIGADLTKNEITAHATGAAFVDPEVDTIFEIGGQDSKYIRLERGAIVDFTMNKVCAAGTGSFLEEQANKLDISVKGEFQDLALSSQKPAVLGERCTVFMESNLNLAQQKGVPKPDLLAGLAYSVVTNYLNRVVENRSVGEHIFFQGGTAANKAVKAAFEAVTGRPVTVPPHHDVLGAVGCALLAREHHLETGKRTTFVGFDLSSRNYSMKSCECKKCSNNCEIHVVEIAGEEKKLFYGDRCGRYDETRQLSAGRELPDLFAERRKLLEESGAVGVKGKRRGTVGVPQMTFFHEYFPFWRAFFETLSCEVVLSGDTNRHTIHHGVENTTAETCLPIKAAHGHVVDLLEKKKVDYIFLPSVVDTPGLCAEMERSYMCPYVQSVPYILDSAMEVSSRARVLRPVIHKDRGKSSMIRELTPMGAELGASRAEVRRAVDAAEEAQRRFHRACEARGRDVLALLPEDSLALVIVSRPYNGCDRGMNLDLPAKLRDLGCLAVPMDFLPLGSVDLSRDWWHMYWKYGQKILAAARLIAKDSRLSSVYITNFGCGPDSFILKFFAKEMGTKPYLQIEVDEHSSDVGAITRCEAFLDSLKNVRPAVPGEYRAYEGPLAIPSRERRTVYVPYMDDHSYALAAALRAGGIDARTLPVSDEESIKLGRKHTSGKECYPCVITTGDILKKVSEPDFDPKRAAFFIPTAMGPCRFGQYNKFHRMILDDLGYQDVRILAFNQNQGFHSDTGKLGAGFLRRGWQSIVAFDTLGKLVREVRPHEKEKGSADRIYQAALRKIEKAIESRSDLLKPLLEVSEEFVGLPVENGGPKPRIGLIGEVYVRCHQFANEYVVRKIEELGGEAVLPPFEEWLNYIAWERRTESVRKKQWGTFFKELVSGHVQRRDRNRIQSIFRSQIRGRLSELPTEEVLKRAEPYIHSTIKGEACLSVGRAVEYAEEDFAGVVNIAPFGCLPSTIVASLTRKFRQNHRNLPWLDLYYDGTSQAGTQTRLEAFMAQAASFARAHLQPAPAGSTS